MNLISAFRGHLLSVEGSTLDETSLLLSDAVDWVLNQECRNHEEYEEEWDKLDTHGAMEYLALSGCTVTLC